MPQPPTVIVLAAGDGRRFRRSGGATHKLEALLAGTPVLQHVLRSVAASGLPCHVVRPLGEQSGAQPAAADGMGNSIARGVAATADAAGWLILPGDLPLVSPQTLRQVAQGLSAQPVVQPFWQGQQGHPVGFGRECRSALMALRGDVGAAAIVRTHRQAAKVLELQLNDPGIAMDIDTVDDLAQAEALLAAQPARWEASHGEH